LFKIFKKQTYSCIKTNDEWRHTYLLKSYGYHLSGGGRADGQGRRKGCAIYGRKKGNLMVFYSHTRDPSLITKEEEKPSYFVIERSAVQGTFRLLKQVHGKLDPVWFRGCVDV